MAEQGRWENGKAVCEAGSRGYRLWVPTGYDTRVAAPLVVMLHGCRQKAEDLARISGMNDVAGKNNFLVVYPEQTIRGNPFRCWNWFEARHQLRGMGEPAILAAVVERVRAFHNVDAERIHVAGISAGAAMAVTLGVTYPEVFSAAGMVAGLEFAAANGVLSGLKAMKQGGPDPNQQGIVAFEAMRPVLGKNSRRRMPIIVFQGEADSTVHPANADQLIEQWAMTNHLLAAEDGKYPNWAVEVTCGAVPDGYAYQKSAYKDPAGRLLMEKWMVKGLDHAWPGSPVAAEYSDPRGPNASEEMWRFFCQATAEPLAGGAHKTFWGRSSELVHGAGRLFNKLLGR